MQAEPTQTFTFKRSVWLGVLCGWMAQLALTALLPILVFVALNFLALATGSTHNYEPVALRTTEPAWPIQEASIFAASLLAGGLAALLSPPRSIKVPVALVLLSLLATCFQQFPLPMSVRVSIIWTAAPVLGLLTGILLTRWCTRARARRAFSGEKT